MAKKATTTEVATNPLKSALTSEKMVKQFENALPSHISSKLFIRAALTITNKIPKLQDCTIESVMDCFLDLAQAGLEPDGRRAHLIPYGNKCTLIIDWKGLVALAKRSGEVETWNSMIVYSGDNYSYKNGDFEHEADPFGDRGEPVGAVSIVTTPKGTKDFEVMSKEDILAIKARSQAKNSGPWVTDELEMWRKTVMRRHSKRLTLSPEFHFAMERDTDRFESLKREPAKITARETPTSLDAPLTENYQAEAVDVESTTEPIADEIPGLEKPEEVAVKGKGYEDHE